MASPERERILQQVASGLRLQHCLFLVPEQIAFGLEWNFSSPVSSLLAPRASPQNHVSQFFKIHLRIHPFSSISEEKVD